MTALHTTTLGEQGTPVMFCHGLFGQGKNWTQAAKTLADRHRVTLVDMPNHGRSAWVEKVDYQQMADAVAELIDEPVALVGHSMGGKVAMMLALHHPELVERLCVVDVSPVAYEHHDEFRGYMDAMLGLELPADASRGDADQALFEAVPNRTVRSFLLQNLRRTDEGWRWQPNLEVLRRDLEELGGWPETDASYDGPVLWIAGALSHYVQDEYAPTMERLFPRVRKVTIKGAGHWVHSQQPAVFAEVLGRFIDAPARS